MATLVPRVLRRFQRAIPSSVDSEIILISAVALSVELRTGSRLPCYQTSPRCAQEGKST